MKNGTHSNLGLKRSNGLGNETIPENVDQPHATYQIVADRRRWKILRMRHLTTNGAILEYLKLTSRSSLPCDRHPLSWQDLGLQLPKLRISQFMYGDYRDIGPDIYPLAI